MTTHLVVERPAQELTSGPQLMRVTVEATTVLTYWARATPTKAPRPTRRVEGRILKTDVELELRV
jgi:hypothetical protein